MTFAGGHRVAFLDENDLNTVERHDLRPDQCIVVEDSESGLAAAMAAGVDCIIVLSEWTRSGNFSGALAVVENIAGVPEEVFRRHVAKPG